MSQTSHTFRALATDNSLWQQPLQKSYPCFFGKQAKHFTGYLKAAQHKYSGLTLRQKEILNCVKAGNLERLIALNVSFDELRKFPKEKPYNIFSIAREYGHQFLLSYFYQETLTEPPPHHKIPKNAYENLAQQILDAILSNQPNQTLTELLNHIQHFPRETRTVIEEKALLTAIEQGHINIARFLIDDYKMNFGFDSFRHYMNQYQEPLFAATRTMQDEIISNLLYEIYYKKSLVAYQSNHSLMTLIHIAAKEKQASTLTLLLEHPGIRKTAGMTWISRSKTGKTYYFATALHFAVQTDMLYVKRKDFSPNDVIETVRVLLSAPIDINAPDFHGMTALHFAVQNKQKEVVRELLQVSTINIHIKNHKGEIPLDLVGDDEEIEYLLLEKGNSQKEHPSMPVKHSHLLSLLFCSDSHDQTSKKSNDLQHDQKARRLEELRIKYGRRNHAKTDMTLSFHNNP